MLDNFLISGIHGTHVCMVFEVLGNNLLKPILRSNYHGIPMENVRKILRQALEGLMYLHDRCGIIHTDIKPENLLVVHDEQRVRQMAREAFSAYRTGRRLPENARSTAAPEILAAQIAKMSKSHKKKLKKRRRKNRDALKLQLCESGIIPAVETPNAPTVGSIGRTNGDEVRIWSTS